MTQHVQIVFGIDTYYVWTGCFKYSSSQLVVFPVQNSISVRKDYLTVHIIHKTAAAMYHSESSDSGL